MNGTHWYFLRLTLLSKCRISTYSEIYKFILIWFVIGILDIVLNFPGYHRWKCTDILRNVLKIIDSLAWSIVLPLCYIHQNDNNSMPFGRIKDILSSLDRFEGIPSLYLMAVTLYLIPNLLSAALFIFPMLRRWIENSDWLIVRFLLWWSQVQTFVYYSLLWSFTACLSVDSGGIWWNWHLRFQAHGVFGFEMDNSIPSDSFKFYVWWISSFLG